MTAASRRVFALGVAAGRFREPAATRTGPPRVGTSLLGTGGASRAAVAIGGLGAGLVVRGLVAAAAPGPTARGTVGVVIAVVLGGAIATGLGRWVQKLEPASVVARREAIAAAFPLSLDLIAACADAGLPVSAAVPVLSECVGAPLGEEFAGVHALLLLGASRDVAWARLADPATGGPAVATAVRSVLAAELRGTRLAGTLGALSADQREAAAARVEAAAHRAGVRAVAPLGLCFLPAFVVLGIVPVVASALSRLL